MNHTRISDTELLMQFARDFNWGEKHLLEAVSRLEKCHKEGLADYTVVGAPIERDTATQNTSTLDCESIQQADVHDRCDIDFTVTGCGYEPE